MGCAFQVERPACAISQPLETMSRKVLGSRWMGMGESRKETEKRLKKMWGPYDVRLYVMW